MGASPSHKLTTDDVRKILAEDISGVVNYADLAPDVRLAGLKVSFTITQYGMEKRTGWTRRRIDRATRKLRNAGFLTEYGAKGRYWIAHDPAERLPAIEVMLAQQR